MTTKEAVQALVAYVDQAPSWDQLADGIRVVLHDFKEQNQVALRLERIVHEFIKESEAPRVPVPEGLFDDLPAQPVTGHPER